jgi:hypothetical protein
MQWEKTQKIITAAVHCSKLYSDWWHMSPLGYTYFETALNHTDTQLSLNQWNQNKLLLSEYILISLSLLKERQHAYQNHHAVLLCSGMCVCVEGKETGSFELWTRWHCQWITAWRPMVNTDLVRWNCNWSFEKYSSYIICLQNVT